MSIKLRGACILCKMHDMLNYRHFLQQLNFFRIFSSFYSKSLELKYQVLFAYLARDKALHL